MNICKCLLHGIRIFSDEKSSTIIEATDLVVSKIRKMVHIHIPKI